MPGKGADTIRPVGYGVIDWREGAIVSDGWTKAAAPQITPFPTGRLLDGTFQASGPSGTNTPAFLG